MDNPHKLTSAELAAIVAERYAAMDDIGQAAPAINAQFDCHKLNQQIDRDYDDQSQSADGQVLLFIVKLVGVVCGSAFLVWVAAGLAQKAGY